MLGFSIGPLLGGALTHVTGWRVIFWLNVLLMLAAIAGLASAGSATARADGTQGWRADWTGFVLLAMFMVSLVFGLHALPHVEAAPLPVVGPFVLAAAAFSTSGVSARDPTIKQAISRSHRWEATFGRRATRCACRRFRWAGTRALRRLEPDFGGGWRQTLRHCNDDGIHGRSRSNPCRARCHGTVFGRAQGRSTGRTSQQEQKGSRVPKAIASRSGPSGSAKPHNPEPLCRRRSSASPDHGAGARRRSRPRIRQGDQIPTAGTTQPMRVDHSCQCVRRPEHHSPSPSNRSHHRVRDRQAAQCAGAISGCELQARICANSRTPARLRASRGSSGGFGCGSLRYSMIANDSNRIGPSPSIKAGKHHHRVDCAVRRLARARPS